MNNIEINKNFKKNNAPIIRSNNAKNYFKKEFPNSNFLKCITELKSTDELQEFLLNTEKENYRYLFLDENEDLFVDNMSALLGALLVCFIESKDSTIRKYYTTSIVVVNEFLHTCDRFISGVEDKVKNKCGVQLSYE